MNCLLPPSNKVNISSLGCLFENTTNSYKFVFFQAIINLLQKTQPTDGSVLLKMEELAVEMVALAWYPHAFCKLSFGTADKLGRVLDRLQFSLNERAIAHAVTRKNLRNAIKNQYDQIGIKGLLRYVPYRLLTPFFPDRLHGKLDSQKDQLIFELSVESYETKDPALYRFVDDGSAIEIHPDWVTYLTESWRIVEGWVGKNWIDYLQSRNPNTPSIPNKISPPLNRSPLTSQTNYWRAVINEKSVNCLYSGVALNPREFALDHFIPWSFVCHDQIWNLIPVTKEANSSKSNSLPSDYYLDGFIKLQLEGLKITRRKFNEGAWSKLTEPFVSDLRIVPENLLDEKSLKAAYHEILPSMMSLAGRIGFHAGWKHSS